MGAERAQSGQRGQYVRPGAVLRPVRSPSAPVGTTRHGPRPYPRVDRRGHGWRDHRGERRRLEPAYRSRGNLRQLLLPRQPPCLRPLLPRDVVAETYVGVCGPLKWIDHVGQPGGEGGVGSKAGPGPPAHVSSVTGDQGLVVMGEPALAETVCARSGRAVVQLWLQFSWLPTWLRT